MVQEMEYVVFGIVAAGLVALMFVFGMYESRKERKRLLFRLRNHYGEVREREYRPEEYASISRFFSKHSEKGQIDDITWNDLGMDDVFKRLNDTYSSAGEEVLYYTLRTP